LKENAQLIKVFKTYSWYFFNPKIEIYRPSRQGEASSSIIPYTYSERDSYALSFVGGSYGKEPLSFWIWPGTKIQRVIISEKKIDAMGIFLYNGSGKTELGIKSGFIRKRISLSPYERKAIIFEPSRSFPFTKYIYNVSISCGKEGGTFASIETDPKRIANALIEMGDAEDALSILSKEDPRDRERWSVLGIAYSMSGRYKDALEAFRKGLAPSVKELLDDNEWEKTLEKSTNIDLAFLKDSLTVNYNIDQFYQQVGRKMGWMAHFDPKIDRPGFLLFGPYKRLPTGCFKAIFKIRVIGSGKGQAARIDVFNGESIIAERIISDTKDKVEEFSLDFYNDEPDRPIEFRVEALGGRELWAEEIKVLPDIYSQYKKFLSKVHHYWGLSAGELGLREEAMNHFKIANYLGYKDPEGIYHMARTYEKLGMKEESMSFYRKVIDEIPNHLDSLLALRRLTRDVGLEKSIKAISPEHEVRQVFGDSIEFIGYSIGKEKIHPGGEFNISYFWRSLKKIRSNYFIFVHFRKGGITVFQNDYPPSLKMNKWKTGGVVREDYTIKVPPTAPAGNYDIIIGVWDPEGTKERLRLKGQKTDEIKIVSIDVINQ